MEEGGSQLLGYEQSRRCRCGISGTAFNPKKGERPWLRMILGPVPHGKGYDLAFTETITVASAGSFQRSWPVSAE